MRKPDREEQAREHFARMQAEKKERSQNARNLMEQLRGATGPLGHPFLGGQELPGTAPWPLPGTKHWWE